MNRVAFISIGINLLLSSSPVSAQITVDPSTNSLILPNGNTVNIEGGIRSGSNLFHSFSEFNVREGQSVIFANPSQITNIFTRVTGKTASEILGTLGVAGEANLYFVNPNGIIFGPNTTLDIAGSFYGSTANAITFDNGVEFGTKNLDNRNALLTVNHPVALVFQNSKNSDIVVKGNGHSFSSPAPFVPISEGEGATGTTAIPGGTLALIGGQIKFEGGVLRALNRPIELAAVQKGIVKFDQNNNFNYGEVQKWNDISFSSRSAINGSVFGETELTGNGIDISGRNIEIAGNSLVLMQNLRNDNAGGIHIKATRSLQLSSNLSTDSLNTSVIVQMLGKGGGGNIQVSAPRILVDGGANLETNTFSVAKGGNVLVNTRNLEVSDFESNFNSSNIGTMTFGEGTGGNLSIIAENVEVKDGAVLNSFSFGTGAAGNVSVNAANTITLITGQGIPGANSFLGSLSFSGGRAGDVSVSAKSIFMVDGATLGSFSFAQGDAGDVSVVADLFETSGPNIDIQPPDLPVGEEESPTILSGLISSSISPSPETTENAGQGSAGTLLINVKKINLADNGAISVSNTGSGEGGQLLINSEDINLTNFSRISSETNSGNGGNVDLNTGTLTLSQSQITSSARGQGDGNGGNILITAEDRVLLQDNSAIAAEAVGGNGGNILINTGALLQDTSSEITATSELGVDGEIVILIPEDSERDFSPETETQNSTQNRDLITSCINQPNQINKFIVRGNEGFPRNPYDNLSDLQWFGLDEKFEEIEIAANMSNKSTQAHSANTILKTTDGRIIAVYVDPSEGEEVCSRIVKTEKLVRQ